MHVRTLGRAELSANGTRLGPEAPVAFPLLLHLVLERDRWVPRIQLEAMVFPEQDHQHARHSLRQSVYTLRKEGFPIEGSGPALHIPGKAVVDDYSALLTPQLDAERELTDLMGGWLAGFEPTISPAYSHWFESKRGEIAHRMRTALLAELAVHKRNARWGQCERTCRAILSLDPLNEEATLGLAEALALTGAKVQAIRILERYQEEMPNADLQLPARVLRRRISEQLPTVTRERTPSVLLGREREMQVLSRSLEYGLTGRACGTLICGDPGIGKSRLLSEIERVAVLSGFRVIFHACQPQDRERPLGVFTSIIPRLRAMKGALGCAPEALALLARLEAVPEAQSASTLIATDWAQYANSLSWAIVDLVSALTAESPLLLLVDDSHLADPASLSVLSDLLDSTDRRLVLALSTRRQSIATSFGGTATTCLTLRPLSTQAGRALFLAEFGGRDNSEELIRWAESAAAGNPLFLVTLARHAGAHPESRRLPTELEHLLEERLADLSARDSQVFSTICALGRHATYPILQHTLSLPHHELLDAIARLDDQGFTHGVGDRIEPTHPLFADRALQRLPRSARQFLFHLAAHAVTETIGGDDLTAMWDVVHMTRRSGATSKALTLARQLARHALAIGRPYEACNLLLEMRPTASSKPDQLSLIADIAVSARAAGRWKLAKEAAQELLGVGLVTDLTRSELLFVGAEADWHLTHEYIAIAPRLRACLTDDTLPAASRNQAAELLLISAVNLNDSQMGHAAIEAARTSRTAELDLDSLAATMIFEMSFGSVDKAGACAERLIAQVNPAPLTIRSIRHLCNGAAALWFAGDADRALCVLRDGYERSLRHNLQAGTWRCANEIANILLGLNHVEEAEQWADRVDDAARAAESGVDTTISQELRYWILVLKGDALRALPLAQSMRRAAAQRSGRSTALALAANTLAEVMLSGMAPAETVASVKQEYLAHRGKLESELWTWAVAEILRRTHRIDEALSLVRDYVETARRENGPIRSALAAYTQALPEAPIRDANEG